jgi:hypothetical protein
MVEKGLQVVDPTSNRDQVMAELPPSIVKDWKPVWEKYKQMIQSLTYCPHT